MKRIITLFMLFTLLLGVLPIANANAANVSAYKDVPEKHTYFKEIQYLKEQGITDNTVNFNPTTNATRLDIIVMVAKALKLDGTQRTTAFKDIPKSNPYSGLVQSAYEKGIVTGYPDGNLKPNEHVSRGHMTAFIARGFKDTLNVNSVKYEMFKDVKKNSTEYEPIKILAGAGVITGYGDNMYRPDLKISRQHVATILYRAIHSVKSNNSNGLLEIHRIPLSYGESLLVKSAEGKAFLINTGISSDNAKLVSYLKKQNVKALEYVIVMNEDAAAYDGIEMLHKSIPVGGVFHGMDAKDTSFLTAMERMKTIYGVDVLLLEKGAFIKVETGKNSNEKGFSVIEGLDSFVNTGNIHNATGRLLLKFKYLNYELIIGEKNDSLISSQDNIIRTDGK